MNYLVLSIGTKYMILKKATDGILHIDYSNPEKDLYLFEVNNLDDIENKKQIVLKVEKKENSH